MEFVCLLQKYREQLRGNSFFLETEHYWRPASSTGALYDQLAKKKYREIPRSRIRYSKPAIRIHLDYLSIL